MSHGPAPWPPAGWATDTVYGGIVAFVDELARSGVALAVVAPGSRNAPLALALAAHPDVRSVSVLDERAAGFFAVGAARACAQPAVVAVTSGTAVANLHPAIAEADQGNVPLLALTADRPPELRDTGAGQAIDQLGIFGRAVRWFVDAGNHAAATEALVYHRSLATRAHARTLAPRPGPVHVNFPLREPLAPPPPGGGSDDPARGGAVAVDETALAGRGGGAPWHRVVTGLPLPDDAELDALAAELARIERGLIVVGHLGACTVSASRERSDASASGALGCDRILRLAARLGWPLLAEPTSGARIGPEADPSVVCHYDLFLGDPEIVAALEPELVLRFGETPTSKTLRAALARWPQLVCDPWLAWHEPTRRAERVVQAAPDALVEALLARLDERGEHRERTSATGGASRWHAMWTAAERATRGALAGSERDAFSEPAVARALTAAIGDGSLLWLSSSLPIRAVETFVGPRAADVVVLANRGANGIDGVVSAAAGAALARGRRLYLLIGELALLHDLGGLLAARRLGLEPTIVCVNNAGGGIFEFLPVAASAPRPLYEEFIATPHDPDFAALAQLAGLELREPAGSDELARALDEPGLVVVHCDRRVTRNAWSALRERAVAAARAALGL